MVKQYAIPELMDEDEIRSLYRYEASFLSSAKGQKDLLEQAEKKINDDRNINLAFRFAQGKTKDRLERFKSDLAKALRENVSHAVKMTTKQKRRSKLLMRNF